MTCILAIDQGTTSTRAMVFDHHGQPLATVRRELRQIFPNDGWVEHDPEEIWEATVDVTRRALSHVDGRVAGIGIANQRETAVLWERASGRPIHNAIVWQDRRTAGQCRQLVDDGVEEMIRARTGLLIDPYFSATKIAWLLDHVDGARAAAERGELAFGTIDGWLLWRLSGGRTHATDATNAARTLLYNIHTLAWDDDLLRLFRTSLLPEVRDNAFDFAVTPAGLLGARMTVRAMAGDQQAAAIGQGCVRPGMAKSTYGTGCFIPDEHRR